MPKRIHRSSEWDEFMQHELSCRWRYKQPMTVSHRGQYFELKYRKDRWYRLNDGFSKVKQRDLFCWIMLNGAAVGAFEMAEFDAGDVDPNEFELAMDTSSASAYEMAKVIRSRWGYIDDVTDYGTILHFERAWMEPAHARTGLWAEAARTVIAVEFRRYSIMVMKAYPLEYEGRIAANYKTALKRRQRAMVRHYHALFGVKPFLGKHGNEGWLWRPHPRLEGLTYGPVSPTPFL